MIGRTLRTVALHARHIAWLAAMFTIACGIGALTVVIQLTGRSRKVKEYHQKQGRRQRG